MVDTGGKGGGQAHARKVPGGCARARLLVAGVGLFGFVIGTPRCMGADQWGGSIAITTDYFVRGISRSNDRAALQLDLHYLNTAGLVAGFFASNTQIDPQEPRDVELDAFLGYVWSVGDDWQAKAIAGYYSYPWNAAGSQYNYAELDLGVTYQHWLDFRVSYSPNSPRYIPYRGLVGVTAESAEVDLQRPVLGKLSGTAGIGYYALHGPDVTGYTYWSVGAAYDLAPVSLALSYIDTTAAAKALSYNAAAGGRWTGTVIWRF